MLTKSLCLFALLVILAACLNAYCDLDDWRGGVVLLCAGHDPVRIWPWPPVSPWYEEAPPTPSNWLTGKAFTG